jgi:hypothetical protein
MSRVVLKNGRWFDTDKAKKWEEDTHWLSVHTRSQWDHEALYHTASGTWVLHHWSQWQGSIETWEIITNEEAAEWLSRNDHLDVPQEIKEIIEKLEI